MKHARRPQFLSLVSKFVPLAGIIGCLGACNARADSDTSQISDLLLKLLTSQGKAICVDGSTFGEPLAAFRSMLPAPDPARRPLFWSSPAALEDGRALSSRELINDEFTDEQIVLPERLRQRAALPATEQLQLNALAREASIMSSDSVTLSNSAGAPLAQVRWWLLNRVSSSCGPNYTISKLVILHDTAFLSVTAGHRGTTYAFQKKGPTWAPIAQWGTWLY
jgi:hypothetical protein